MNIGLPDDIPERTAEHGPDDFYEWGLIEYLNQQYNQGCEYFRNAAFYDHSGAEFMLGLACRNGRGQSRNNSRARRFFVQSILHGDNANAMCNIGLMYWRGESFPRDSFAALFWLKRSLHSGGPPEAAFNMAEIYRLEQGYIDLQQAANYYQIAQDRGHANTVEPLEILRRQGFVPNVYVD